MREGYQGISEGSRARKQRRHSSCVWEGEGSREKQIKGQKQKKIEVTGNAQKGDSPGREIGRVGLQGRKQCCRQFWKQAKPG